MPNPPTSSAKYEQAVAKAIGGGTRKRKRKVASHAPVQTRTRVRLDFTITHDKPIALFSVLDMAEGAIRAADDSDRPDVYIEPGARMTVSRAREYRQDSEAHDGKRVPVASQRKRA